MTDPKVTYLKLLLAETHESLEDYIQQYDKRSFELDDEIAAWVLNEREDVRAESYWVLPIHQESMLLAYLTKNCKYLDWFSVLYAKSKFKTLNWNTFGVLIQEAFESGVA